MEGMENFSTMNFNVSEEQEMLLEQVDKACQKLRPIEDKCYLEGKFNDQIAPIFKEAQLLGLPISAKYGDGQGADIQTYMLMLQRIGQEGCSVRTFFSGHISIGMLTIQEWGNEEQKERYLPPGTKGDELHAFGLTEPNAGSDPGAASTVFEDKGDHYVLNGSKAWISNATKADVMTVYAYPKGKKEGMCAFIIEKDMEGVSTEEETHKMGLVSSDTGSIFMDNAIVPKENLLGPEGKGMTVALATLMNGRLSVAAGCIGVMEDCMRDAADYAKERVQHGKPIAKHQLIQRHLGIMSTNYEAAKLLLYRAAAAKHEYDIDTGNKAKRSFADAMISRAKYFASNYAFDVADRAVQIYGANGYSLHNRVGRHFCDCRVTRIYEGANEILEQKIALDILGSMEYAAFR